MYNPDMGEYIIPITIKPLDEGGYLATSTALQGLVAEGRSVAEAVEIAQDVARKIIESMTERGEPLPAALSSTDPAKTEVKLVMPVSSAG
jgi:predicted RNase H-like HicB family nuclease